LVQWNVTPQPYDIKYSKQLYNLGCTDATSQLNTERTKSAIIHFHATIQGRPRWDDY